MGIRFLCPNGHALNVKAHLANRRGICPHCQAQFMVPGQSCPQVRVAAIQRATVESTIVPHTASPPMPPPVEPPQPQPQQEALWHLRLPSGEQFGPASTEILRQWVSEGRVSVDSYLWQTGWPQWRPAGEVFRDAALPQTGEPAPSVDPTAAPLDLVQHPTRRQTQRQRARRMRFWLLLALSLAVAAMVPALVLVLRRQ
jgi:hypothetical protein